MLVLVFEVNKWRLPAAALRNAAADSIRHNRSHSLHIHVRAIASTCMCNCIYMYVQSTRQHISGNKTNEMKSLK